MIILERAVRQQNRQVAVIRAPAHFAYDPVAQRYEELFGQLEWSGVAEKDERLPQRGRLPHSEAAYSKDGDGSLPWADAGHGVGGDRPSVERARIHHASGLLRR